MTRALVNTHLDQRSVAAPNEDAAVFHRTLAGYRPTPVHDLGDVAAELGLAAVGLKDETDRLGLPAFKILGASWAIEQTLHARPEVDTLVAASAGNHGRAVAHLAAQRSMKARIFVPERSAPARRETIAGEGAEVIVVNGDYEDAVRLASLAAESPRAAEIADVGESDAARWVIDGYATLFSELDQYWDAILVPTGVGSLAAAGARHAAATGTTVVAVEPESAACLTTSLAAGRPTPVPTPGTSMAGLDCAEVSLAAWPSLRDGIQGTLLVSDQEADAALRELHRLGLSVGHCGAAALAALRAAVRDQQYWLRHALHIGHASRVLLLATEGVTDPALVTSPESTSKRDRCPSFPS